MEKLKKIFKSKPGKLLDKGSLTSLLLQWQFQPASILKEEKNMQSFPFRNCTPGLLYVAEMWGTSPLVFMGHLILRTQQTLGTGFGKTPLCPHPGRKILQTVIS